LEQKMTTTNGGRMFIERAIGLFVNGERLMTFMAVPENLEELGLGHLIASGLVRSPDDVTELRVDEAQGRIEAVVRGMVNPPPKLGFTKSGEVDFSSLPLRAPVEDIRFSLRRLEQAATEMVESASLYKRTGGVHSAASGDAARLFCFEDAGRVNAMDKAIGAIFRHGLDISRSFILLTGRIAFEMLMKAAVAGAPVVGSLNIPSDMAAASAERLGITLVGKLLHDKQHIYTHPHRIDCA
jgi:FdhD protein